MQTVLEAGEAILEAVAGVTFAEYVSSRYVRPTVERHFITVGEALNDALRLEPALEHRITAAREIVDFRNVLAHDYSVIYSQAVWDIIDNDLPRLLAEVRALLTPP